VAKCRRACQGLCSGEENQSIVNEVKDRVEIVRLGHFDVRLEKVPTRASEIRIARWVMNPGEVKANYYY